MPSGSSKKKLMNYFESGFSVIYLSVVIISGIYLTFKSAAGSEAWQFGIMALVLFAGDSCHLIPRILSQLSPSKKDYSTALGLGKLAASITMTIFYVLLWNIGVMHYQLQSVAWLWGPVSLLAALRLALCLAPQNRWTGAEKSLKWPILRNIPFVLLGLAVMAAYAAGALIKHDGLSFMWLAIFISFACYIPVVLWSGKNPKIGMLMLPKSCAYAAIILMSFSLN
ncbi:MAG: hypothetical protein LBU32_26220 [Clostridiales bacterium]|jgi:hypothetical protein|nr:hypothetical protein [Clostridiales bacterium]